MTVSSQFCQVYSQYTMSTKSPHANRGAETEQM